MDLRLLGVYIAPSGGRIVGVGLVPSGGRVDVGILTGSSNSSLTS